jgi:hypothetical protein
LAVVSGSCSSIPWLQFLTLAAVTLVTLLTGLFLMVLYNLDLQLQQNRGQVQFQIYWQQDADHEHVARQWEKAPHRSLLFCPRHDPGAPEMKRPLIGVVNSANEIVPGHMHLDIIARAVKDGVRMAGGTPMEFPTIGVCDGWP